jgi:hypothetical protein
MAITRIVAVMSAMREELEMSCFMSGMSNGCSREGCRKPTERYEFVSQGRVKCNLRLIRRQPLPELVEARNAPLS